jgi:8-oxo-dGTP pyrophosphatase MutT (NUDIX family)
LFAMSYMEYISFIAALEARLKRPLPGVAMQLQMASEARFLPSDDLPDPADARDSSVLIMLYPEHEAIKTVFILRTSYEGVHSGQVGFPGGQYEAGDATPYETALREAREETGVDVSHLKILGKLTDLYIPPSNFNVFPVVGCFFEKPFFTIDSHEVVRLIETDISELLDERVKKRTRMVIRGHNVGVPYFDIDGMVVWGATAMILNELLAVIRDVYQAHS